MKPQLDCRVEKIRVMWEAKPPTIKQNWISMVTAPVQLPRRFVPYFASMLIEAFLYVKFVPFYINNKINKEQTSSR